MRSVAVGLFLGGLLLWIRVMFFGVQRRVSEDRVYHRGSPLALAALFVTVGSMLYARPAVTPAWAATVVLAGLGAAAAAWWFVKRSAAVPSTDPEDDPRYRFQGHVARVTQPIEARGDGVPSGRIAFSIDGKRHELEAVWTPDGGPRSESSGQQDDEVVIDRVEGDVAYVEAWTAVEERL